MYNKMAKEISRWMHEESYEDDEVQNHKTQTDMMTMQ